jgi:DNA-binding Lrp family transcriptional regulator
VSEIALRLLNEFQRGFPLCERPFLEVAARLGCGEQ